ncbi:MAG: hypothetical protein IPN95_06715 [Bacteroidetes bacterium]|nr:hypothetical protein [Bacteroidota bacterium]
MDDDNKGEAIKEVSIFANNSFAKTTARYSNGQNRVYDLARHYAGIESAIGFRLNERSGMLFSTGLQMGRTILDCYFVYQDGTESHGRELRWNGIFSGYNIGSFLGAISTSLATTSAHLPNCPTISTSRRKMRFGTATMNIPNKGESRFIRKRILTLVAPFSEAVLHMVVHGFVTGSMGLLSNLAYPFTFQNKRCEKSPHHHDHDPPQRRLQSPPSCDSKRRSEHGKRQSGNSHYTNQILDSTQVFENCGTIVMDAGEDVAKGNPFSGDFTPELLLSN